MARRDSENCHLNLSLSAVCDYGISLSCSLNIFDVCCWQYHVAVIMICLFLTVLCVSLQCVIMAVPGRTYLLLN